MNKKLPGEDRIPDYIRTLKVQDEREADYRKTLSQSIKAIISAETEDLADLEGVLDELDTAVTKAKELRASASGKLQATIGHLTEMLSGVLDMEQITQKQRQTLTILMNLRTWIQGDLATNTVIMSIVDITVWKDALLNIDPERREKIIKVIEEIKRNERDQTV